MDSVQSLWNVVATMAGQDCYVRPVSFKVKLYSIIIITNHNYHQQSHYLDKHTHQ